MRHRIGKIIWGLTIIAAGVLVLLGVLGYFDPRDFFSTWWPMILIIPCGYAFLFEGFGGGSLIGLVIGGMFLLKNLGYIDEKLAGKLIFPVALILVGILVVIRSFTRDRGYRHVYGKTYGPEGDKRDSMGNPIPEYVAVFGGRTERFAGMPFYGAKLEAVFGSVNLDLDGAMITGNCMIEANATFGGVNIVAPRGVKVQVHSSGMFGGTNKSASLWNQNVPEDAPVIEIYSTSIFGGVKIV